MRKVVIYSLIIVGILVIVYLLYRRFVKVNSNNSVVNQGVQSPQTYKDFLTSEGVPDSELDDGAQLMNIETRGADSTEDWHGHVTVLK